MTVHKAQGSEFEKMAVILPPDKDCPVVTRELLYTALTRLSVEYENGKLKNPRRSRLHLWGDEAVFKAAVARRTSRDSGLLETLSEI